jgi:hypothetical protein
MLVDTISEKQEAIKIYEKLMDDIVIETIDNKILRLIAEATKALKENKAKYGIL